MCNKNTTLLKTKVTHSQMEKEEVCVKCKKECDPIVCHCCHSYFCDDCVDYVCKWCGGCCLCENFGKFVEYKGKRCKNCE